MTEPTATRSTETWSVDLPNWHSEPDPEIAGALVWVHTDYYGKPDVALAIVEEGDNRVSVLLDPLILPGEIDGQEQATFRDWDKALEFALSYLADN